MFTRAVIIFFIMIAGTIFILRMDTDFGIWQKVPNMAIKPDALTELQEIPDVQRKEEKKGQSNINDSTVTETFVEEQVQIHYTKTLDILRDQIKQLRIDAAMLGSTSSLDASHEAVSASTSVPPQKKSDSVFSNLLSSDDERARIRSAIVKIECPAEGGGKYIGSGFAVGTNTVLTAGHVVMNAATATCTVIFPKDRAPVHYFDAIIDDLPEVRRLHNEDGVDIAVLRLQSLLDIADAIPFASYPVVSYPVCDDPRLLGNATLHFGYPGNFQDNNYLVEEKGSVAALADITGVEDQLSEDQRIVYKSPLLEESADQTHMHPYMISRVATFYGDSGGLVFNETHRCILGIQRSATIGNSPGENFSLFLNLSSDEATGVFSF